MLDNSYDMPESVQTFDAFWRVWHAGESRPERRRDLSGIRTAGSCIGWITTACGSIPGRRPIAGRMTGIKRAHYMLIEDGDIRFGAVEPDRSAMLARHGSVNQGTMLETDLQDAMFFFRRCADEPGNRCRGKWI